jgi:universal stress protein E
VSWRKVLLSVPDPKRIEPHVLAKTAQLAHGLDAGVELFHPVFDASLVRAGRLHRIAQADVIARVKDTRRHLERAADFLRDQNIRVRTAVRWDYPPDAAVARQALRHKPDLLIAASSRRGRSSALTYSDFRLLQSCPCPVLMIKTAKPYGGRAVLAALDPSDATAGEPTLDRMILTAANTLASALDAPLHACHAVPALLTPVPGTGRVVPADGGRQATHLKAARDKTRALTVDFGLATRHVHVAQGTPEFLVDSLVKETHADVVTIGSMALARTNGMLIGRIAERLLNSLDCDVLLVKPPGYRSPVARQCIQLMPAAHARRGQRLPEISRSSDGAARFLSARSLWQGATRDSPPSRTRR